jgi:hypothetical protein
MLGRNCGQHNEKGLITAANFSRLQAKVILSFHTIQKGRETRAEISDTLTTIILYLVISNSNSDRWEKLSLTLSSSSSPQEEKNEEKE